MSRAVAAEALKLRTTRTSWALASGGLAAALAVAAATALAGDPADADLARQGFTAAGISHVFALLLGTLAVTTEFRHGTIAPTLFVQPDRRRVLAAKLAAAMGAGGALGLLAFGLAAVVVVTALGSRDVATGLAGGEVAGMVAGGAAGAALFAALGVGLGALVRNQAGAIVGALGWIYVGETLLGLLPGLGDTVQRLGLGGLSSGVAGTTSPDPDLELLAQLPAGLLLATWAAAIVAAGALALSSRDVG